MFISDTDGGALCIAVAIIGAVLWWGNALTQHDPKLRGVGVLTGTCAFISVAGYQLVISPPVASAEFVPLIGRSLVAGALFTGIGWCASVPLIAAYRVLVLPVLRLASGIHSASVARRNSEADNRRRAEEEKRRAEEYERGAPERERRARGAAAESNRARESQRRRESAREACELVFALHRPEIVNRFKRADMERFFKTYMRDSHDANDVERRGRELQKIIEAHSLAANPDRKRFSVAELSAWYLEEKERIEKLAIDEELRQTHIANLDSRYMELSQSLFERAVP